LARRGLIPSQKGALVRGGLWEEALVVRPGAVVVAKDEVPECLEVHGVVPKGLQVVGVGQGGVVALIRLGEVIAPCNRFVVMAIRLGVAEGGDGSAIPSGQPGLRPTSLESA